MSDDLKNLNNLKVLHKYTKLQHNKSLNEITQLFSIKLYNSYKTALQGTNCYHTMVWISDDRS